MFDFIKKIKQKNKHRRLIVEGVLTPIKSFEEYADIVKSGKENSEQKLFTNCYMLPEEIKRLISLNNFYSVKTNNGVVFVDDEYSYYYMFLFVDLTKPLTIAKLDKDILVEDVYYEGRKNDKQEQFENLIQSAGCIFLNTYNAVADRPQIPPEKYWKRISALEKSLALEGKKITIPSHKQLKQFEKIYRNTINKFVQKRYTKKERKKQADMGYLHCVADSHGELYAIQISSYVHGGAIASREDCQGNLYAPALSFALNKYYYENMPQDPDAQKEYMRSKGIGGWIAVDNTASWRLHKALGITAIGKSMNQFVVSAEV